LIGERKEIFIFSHGKKHIGEAGSRGGVLGAGKREKRYEFPPPLPINY